MLQRQFTALMEALPGVVAENIRIATEGNREGDRLKAIQMIYDSIGMSPDNLTPLDSLSRIAQDIAAWTAPLMAAMSSGKLPGIFVDLEDGDVIDVEPTEVGSRGFLPAPVPEHESEDEGEVSADAV
jgi:hypothetical protein